MNKPFDPFILRSKVSFFVELYRKSQALEQRTADLTRVSADLVVRAVHDGREAAGSIARMLGELPLAAMACVA